MSAIAVSMFLSHGSVIPGMALKGMLNVRLARLMVSHLSPFNNFLLLLCVLRVSLCGIMVAIPFYGVVFAGDASEHSVFLESLQSFPVYFMGLFLIILSLGYFFGSLRGLFPRKPI